MWKDKSGQDRFIEIFFQPFDLRWIDKGAQLAINVEISSIIMLKRTWLGTDIIGIKDDNMLVIVVKTVVSGWHAKKIHNHLLGGNVHVVISQYMIFEASILIPEI